MRTSEGFIPLLVLSPHTAGLSSALVPLFFLRVQGDSVYSGYDGHVPGDLSGIARIASFTSYGFQFISFSLFSSPIYILISCWNAPVMTVFISIRHL